MPPEVQTFALIGVGVLIGFLLMSNVLLRREVHNLRQQVTTLTMLIATARASHDPTIILPPNPPTSGTE